VPDTFHYEISGRTSRSLFQAIPTDRQMVTFDFNVYKATQERTTESETLSYLLFGAVLVRLLWPAWAV